MPAVTVQDVLVLPELPTPAAGARPRPVRTVITAPSGFEGEGFPVRRAFAGVAMSELDPFVHMDQMGEVEYAPGEAKGTPWHPHRGFETVTYIIDGTFVHQDSNGGGGTISDGDTQWMTAGAGILHIEAPPEALVVSGGLFHGAQLWVNLPRSNKLAPPRYQDIRGHQASLVRTPDGGGLVRVIAGELGGHKGPGLTFTPITLVHATLSPGAQALLPWRADFNALAYVLAGNATVGSERRPLVAGQLAVLGSASAPGAVGADAEVVQIGAAESQDGRSANVEVLLLGGLPIREPVVHYGPFVMNTKDEIRQALDDYEAGRLGRVPAQQVPHRHANDADLR
ncbi:MAG TPA: pirin family protein [Acidimicrobiales bacterium]|nr:pirin family protein [Acidimicrobiales bacterium]